MLIWDEVGKGWRITYADNIVAEVCIQSPDSLHVTAEEITVAEGNNRFIPRRGVIYAYSRDGSNRNWKLPPDFQGKQLRVFTLSREGRSREPQYELSAQTIRLELEAGVPVKIEVG